MIERFIALLWNTVNGELERLRWTLITVLGATILGFVPVLVFSPSVEVSILWTLAPWLFTAYRLFAIRQFIQIHLTGEALELLQVSASIMSSAAASISAATPQAATAAPVVATQEGTGVLDNPFIRTYLSVITGIFLVQTALFLLLPLYINYTVGGTAMIVLIAMLLTVIAIDNFTSFKKLSRFTVKVAVVAYAVGVIFALFPHVSFYLGGITSKFDVRVVSMSTAKRVNDLAAIQKKQQEKIDNEFVDGIIAWQNANPGAKLPAEYEEALNKARRLGVM